MVVRGHCRTTQGSTRTRKQSYTIEYRGTWFSVLDNVEHGLHGIEQCTPWWSRPWCVKCTSCLRIFLIYCLCNASKTSVEHSISQCAVSLVSRPALDWHTPHGLVCFSATWWVVTLAILGDQQVVLNIPWTSSTDVGFDGPYWACLKFSTYQDVVSTTYSAS